jgi:NTP pyrophosphatase (non-canonical NTP hydrolase)
LNDSSTTVADLRQLVRTFVEERDWDKFHSPKNISMAIAIEVAELMEHFQWIGTEESRAIRDDPSKLQDVGEELADVLCYGLALANTLGLDISESLSKKMEKNRAKYPVARYRGTFD